MSERSLFDERIYIDGRAVKIGSHFVLRFRKRHSDGGVRVFHKPIVPVFVDREKLIFGENFAVSFDRVRTHRRTFGRESDDLPRDYLAVAIVTLAHTRFET